MKKHFLLAGFAALMLVACNNKPASELTLSGLDPVKFQTEVNNAKTALYTLKNKAGMEVCITNFGGRIVSVMVPDKNGKMQDVVLGFDSIADYINVPSDFGASIGRYANRINQGRFVLDGDTIQLPSIRIYLKQKRVFCPVTRQKSRIAISIHLSIQAAIRFYTGNHTVRSLTRSHTEQDNDCHY